MAGFDVGSIVAHVKADLTDFKKGIDEAKQSSGSFKDKFGSFMDDATGASKRFAAGLAVAGAALGAAGGFAVKSASDFEQNRVAFETMLGSAEAARQMLKNLSDFSLRTPFQLPEVVTGAKQLLAYGIAAQDILPDFEALGNISAGVGKDKLPFLTLAFGQVATKGHLAGQEIRQFTEAGVPLIQELAKTLHKTTAEIQAMSENGQISFDDVREAIRNMSGEGGKFFNLMEKQSKTFGGTISNLRDSIGRFARDLVGISDTGDIREGSIFAKLRNAAQALLDWLNNNKEQIKSAIMGIFQWIQDNLPVVIGIIVGALIPAFIALAASIWATIAPLLPFMAIGAALGLLLQMLAEKVGGWSNLWNILTDAATKVWNFLVSFLGPSLEALWNTFTTKLLPSLQRLWEALNPALMQAIKIVAEIMAGMFLVSIWISINVLNVIIGVISNLINWFGNLVRTVGNVISDIGSWFGKLPGYVSSAANAVIDWFKKLPGMITSALGNLDNLLFDIGKRILQGLLNGMKKGFDDVKGFVGGIGGWISDHKGPIEYDKRLLLKQGGAIMQGFNKGLQQGWADTKDLINSMGAGITGAALGGVSANLQGGVSKTFQSQNSNITNITGPINIGSQQDADYLLRRITRNQELANLGLASQPGSRG